VVTTKHQVYNMALTQKQEAFVAKFLECDNASDAYRHAYNTENMKDVTINDTAWKLTIHPAIAQRIKDIKDMVLERLVIDRTYITNGVLNTIDRTIVDRDHSNTLKGYGMLNNMYDLNEDKQNDRLLSDRNKQAILDNYRKRIEQRIINVTPEE